MNVQTAAAVAAALVALAFSMATFERWLARHRRHELAWSVSLLMFALASAALAAGAGVGWNGPVFRLFYLFGAIANVPYLALGTIYLLGRTRSGDIWAAVITAFTAFAAGVLTVAPFTGPLPRTELAQGSEVFGPLPRILAASSSGIAAMVVLGGAVWSAVRLVVARRRAAGDRRSGAPATGRFVVSNSLIAIGTLITGASGLLNSVVGHMTGFALTLVAGITVIFAGFLVATSGGAARPALTTAPAEPAQEPLERPTPIRSLAR